LKLTIFEIFQPFQPTAASQMPTAAAVAAAAATAKIQAMDAVASTAMALGLSKLTTAAPVKPAAARMSPAIVQGLSPSAIVIAPPGVAIPQLGSTPPVIQRKCFCWRKLSNSLIQVVIIILCYYFF